MKLGEGGEGRKEARKGEGEMQGEGGKDEKEVKGRKGLRVGREGYEGRVGKDKKGGEVEKEEGLMLCKELSKQKVERLLNVIISNLAIFHSTLSKPYFSDLSNQFLCSFHSKFSLVSVKLFLI